MTDGGRVGPSIDLERFHDMVFDLRFERPAPGSNLDGHFQSAGNIPIALDAPFGETGPMLFRFGDMLSLLFDWTTVQSGMRISDPDHLLFDYTRMMMGFRLFRARFDGREMRIEVDRPEIERAASAPVRARVLALAAEIGVPLVTLDLDGFASGKLNRV